MRVAVDVLGSVKDPYIQVQDEHVLAMMLRHGAIEVGPRRAAMRRVTFQAGEIGFFPRHTERWVGAGDQERLLFRISDAALVAASDGIGALVEGHRCKMVDARLAALIAAVNAERIAGFPSGRLFLDSVEQAVAAALIDAYGGRSLSEDELTLVEMAQSVEMSPPHFARMFRKSTGETPHQFVLRNRIERGKEMLCTPRVRILDVAVACGFKTQQHFARVFRRLCGTSPREYQLERWSSDPSEQLPQ